MLLWASVLVNPNRISIPLGQRQLALH